MTLRRLRYLVWPQREPALADAGRSGEIVVAQARLVVIFLLAGMPLASASKDPAERGAWLGIGFSLAGIALGVWILRVARDGRFGARLGIGTSLFDVSLVSGYHLLLFVVGEGGTALHSRVTFALYVLAIMATALRYDGRLPAIAGLVAIAQYLAVMSWADRSGRAGAASGRFFGATDLPGQIEEVILLVAASALGAVFVERTRILRLLGIRDGLTRLANRPYFEERLAQELLRSERSGAPASLAILDLDHFKRVNDTWGHPAGDQALRHVAFLLAARLRATDLPARFGGEEFVVLLPETPRDDARDTLDAIREALHATPLPLRDGTFVPLSFSAGVAAFPDDARTGRELIERADAHLLAAKRAGRNRVVSG